MGVYVTELARGGFSAFGGCDYNPRERRIDLEVMHNEVLDVTIEFQNTPSELNYYEDGIAGSEPVIVGNTITLQFQQFGSCGRYKIDVFFATGSVKSVVFAAHEAQPYYCWAGDTPDDEPSDDEDLDGGMVG